jgi:hypothetical protein
MEKEPHRIHNYHSTRPAWYQAQIDADAAAGKDSPSLKAIIHSPTVQPATKSASEESTGAEAQKDIAKEKSEMGQEAESSQSIPSGQESIDPTPEIPIEVQNEPPQGSELNAVEDPAYDYQNPLSYIAFEKDDSHRHKFNNTGYIFRRKDGKKLSSAEVYRYIRAQKQAGNEDFIRDFQVMQSKDVKASGTEPPMFTIDKPSGRYKWYQYVFDPDWNKKEEKIPEGNEQWVGAKLNVKSIVPLQDRQDGKPFAGIVLHDTPSPYDSGYQERRTEKGNIILPGTELTLIAKGNNGAPGWVMVKTKSGDTGWIEQRYVLPVGEGYKVDFTLRYVKKGDNVESALGDIANLSRDIGSDNRAFAYVLWAMNRDNEGVYVDMEKYEKNRGSWKDAFDPWYAEMRALYSSIEVRYGYVIKVPTPKGIHDMVNSGAVPTRPELVNLAIKGGRIVQGLLEGIPIGMYEQAKDTVTGLWDMIKSIFTGEILDMLVELYEALSNMTWDTFKTLILGMIGVDPAQFEEIWNATNITVEERYKFFGEIIGRIIFEIILAVVTGGAALGKVAAKVPALSKLMSKLGKVDKMLPDEALKKMKKVPDEVTPDAGDLKNLKKLDADAVLKKMPENSRKYELEGKKHKGDRDFDSEAQKDLDKELEKPENQKEKPHRKEKALALATAKSIEAGADAAGLPIKETMALFDFLTAIKGVDRFEYTRMAVGYMIWMIGTKLVVDENGKGGGKKGKMFSSLQGKSLAWIKKQKPKNWRTVSKNNGKGWKWLDEKGNERLIYQRPSGDNAMNSQWSRMENGYFRWMNEKGEFLDVDGKVVSRSDPDYQWKTHIPYEGV